MDVEALLADLDPDQRSAVTTEAHLVAVVAGAGSGKTRVLTRRVAYRVATGDADARHTAVLTFTREAAGELRRRLRGLGLRERVTAGTFHSVAYELLRQRWIDRDQRPRTIAADRKRILADLAGGSGLDALDQEIGWACARGIAPHRYAAELARADRRPTASTTQVVDVLERYHAEKRRRGVVDLDDLIALTNAALAEDAEFAATVRWRFRHLLVDEAQDLNPLQHRFVDLIRAGRDDLFLVGDPSQAIYGFNGADPSLLIDVGDRFPGVEVIRLPVNHRSTPQVVDAGRHVLDMSAQSMELRSSRPDGVAATIASADDEDGEARRIAAAIAASEPALVERTAVLARTHATLARVRRELETAGIPLRAAGDRRATRPLVGEAIRKTSSTELRAWVNDLDEQLENAPADDKRRAVADTVFEFLREQPLGDGPALRTWIDSVDPFGDRRPGVELLTFHAAKGREWERVFAIGCETSLVPHRSATTIAARAEEARLLYVALTRATDTLHVSWAERRGGYQRKPTPLLDGFRAVEPVPIAPPSELFGRERDPGRDVIDRLRAWRDGAARAGGILPDAVCSDRALAAIAERRPASADELDAATGMGTLTARRLFDGVAAALQGAE